MRSWKRKCGEERREFGNNVKYVIMDIYGDSLGLSLFQRVKME
jgi:hypothetical protein